MITSKEQFIIDVLDCGTGDLEMLDEIYSKLAEDVIDTKSIIKELMKNDILDLNTLLYRVYHEVANNIICTAQDLLRENEDIKEDLGEELTKKVLAYIEEMSDEPYTNFQDTHFNNDIDLTVDWDNAVSINAIDLINYIAERI